MGITSIILASISLVMLLLTFNPIIIIINPSMETMQTIYFILLVIAFIGFIFGLIAVNLKKGKKSANICGLTLSCVATVIYACLFFGVHLIVMYNNNLPHSS